MHHASMLDFCNGFIQWGPLNTRKSHINACSDYGGTVNAWPPRKTRTPGDPESW